MAFILIGLTGQRWLPLFLNLAVLAILGSRGSLLGLATGGLVIVWPGLRAGFVTKTYIVLGSLTAGGLLIAWKLRTALHRLHYWQQAGAAFLATPVFGVGPGGIKARQVITEPGGGFQVHAHNLLVSSTAELGLVGLVLLALGGWWLYRHRSSFLIHRWQLAILAGLLAHSMVDEPLWWPGPLLLAALVVGSVKVG
jgi:O-antigen ligase